MDSARQEEARLARDLELERRVELALEGERHGDERVAVLTRKVRLGRRRVARDRLRVAAEAEGERTLTGELVERGVASIAHATDGPVHRLLGEDRTGQADHEVGREGQSDAAAGTKSGSASAVRLGGANHPWSSGGPARRRRSVRTALSARRFRYLSTTSFAMSCSAM